MKVILSVARQSLNTVGIYAGEMLADMRCETHIGMYIATLYNNSKVLEIIIGSGMEKYILLHTEIFNSNGKEPQLRATRMNLKNIIH